MVWCSDIEEEVGISDWALEFRAGTVVDELGVGDPESVSRPSC